MSLLVLPLPRSYVNAMTRYNSTGNRGRSGLGIIISGYVDKLVRKHSHLIHSIATLSLTAQSGEESILVASLRGVIAKQAADIEALQSKLKELTTKSLASAEAATSEASQSAANFSEVRYIYFLSFSSWYIWRNLSQCK